MAVIYPTAWWQKFGGFGEFDQKVKFWKLLA